MDQEPTTPPPVRRSMTTPPPAPRKPRNINPVPVSSTGTPLRSRRRLFAVSDDELPNLEMDIPPFPVLVFRQIGKRQRTL